MIAIFRHFYLYSSRARHNKTPYGKRCKLHNTSLHIRRKFLADINRMPCPVGLRKEQMDYRAPTLRPRLLFALFFLLFRFFVSPSSPLGCFTLFFFLLTRGSLAPANRVAFYLAQTMPNRQVTKIITKGVRTSSHTGLIAMQIIKLRVAAYLINDTCPCSQ